MEELLKKAKEAGMAANWLTTDEARKASLLALVAIIAELEALPLLTKEVPGFWPGEIRVEKYCHPKVADMLNYIGGKADCLKSALMPKKEISGNPFEGLAEKNARKDEERREATGWQQGTFKGPFWRGDIDD